MAAARRRDAESPRSARRAIAERLTIDSAQRELDLRIATLKQEGSAAWQRETVALSPLGYIESAPPRGALLAIWGASALVLLLACANISNLMLYRALANERSTRVHAILGARPARIARMFLAEGLLLTLASAPAAVAVCAALLGALPRLASLVRGAWIYSIDTPDMGLRTIGFLMGLAVVLGVGIALVPAYRGSRISGLPSSSHHIAGATPRQRGVARGSNRLDEVAGGCELTPISRPQFTRP